MIFVFKAELKVNEYLDEQANLWFKYQELFQRIAQLEDIYFSIKGGEQGSLESKKLEMLIFKSES